MIVLTQQQELARVRRIALAAQGLLQPQPFGQGLAGTGNAIEHLGYVQIDTLSVVERAHNHTLHTRVPSFSPPMLETLLVDRQVFEYWTHAAAFIPMADYRFSLPYKHAIQSGQTHWYRHPDKALMKQVLDRIRIDGPLRSRDLEQNTEQQAGWWDWKPAKKALEQLYMEGELMVSNRHGFQKTYDLAERVLPPGVNSAFPSTDEYAAHLVDQQLRCHGLVSLKGFTYLRKNADLRKAVKSLLTERLAAKQLEQLKLPNNDIFYISSGALERPLAQFDSRLQILSPFDNSVIQRQRLKSLFQYDYQIECYVTAAKRKYGYFCLPLLYRGNFVGRMDCKAHRKQRHFEIKSLHFEAHNANPELLIAALVDAVTNFRDFQQCDTISYTGSCGSTLARDFQHAVAGQALPQR